ncbi:serine/threonine-protein kinase 32A isoform X3 [Drosophila mauritiana]|uniref:Serine/threonine-protein kinase 32A isoform X3 n=1 Tax=Drosophila mauritiana TaxID=7226 RepID=A0A6P8K044_DROMA|nr:serine/threonine-protein kinase 32A isoform X3 [Drosophila mauritiana]
MEFVDDLCLERILGLLELPDQIAMMQSYERCRPLLGSIWRHRLTRISLNLLEIPLLGEDFRFLLASACQQLLELRISYLGREHFQALIMHCFPNLWLLQVDVLPPFFLCPRQRLQLIQIIPKFDPEDHSLAMGHMLCVDCQSQIPINFDHFQILRAIGKGSFGKVCIVQKRDSGILYAMKYVSRSACEMRGALGGVIKEVELLSSLEHPFLVNLWFSFQDEEDLFMVCDLLTGGDLRYHLQNRVEFSEQSVALLVCELGSALEYLQAHRVVHRDIKPDNILLDDAGHAHLTDFNIATRLQKNALACSMSGTKPYMAPEVFLCALDEVAGYSYPVDWWSLGVVAYEMRGNIRPFVVHSNTPLAEIKNILNTPVHYPRYWSSNFVDLLQKLLSTYPGARISTRQELHQTPMLRNIDFQRVLEKKIKPIYKPPEDHLNCDPCLELEEMIVESRPLHKKKKRLAKQRSAQRDSDPETALVKEFIVYNRYKELKRKAMEQKENDWQRELELAMANSIVNSLAPIQEKPAASIAHDGDCANVSSAAAQLKGDSIEFIDRTPSPQIKESAGSTLDMPPSPFQK